MPSNRQYVQLLLTCDNEAEADRIIDNLLEQHLIVCAKTAQVSSRYWWHDAIEANDEILIIMESAEDLFEEIEAAITPLHSYDTFVLRATPISTISSNARDWTRDNLRPREGEADSDIRKRTTNAQRR